MARQTIKISCDEMVEMVTREFITGSDPAFLKKVAKTAKGGGIMNDVGKVLRNKSKTFSFVVYKPLFFFMKSRPVYVADDVKKINYLMDPKKDWPKFYENIMKAIANEGNNQ